MTQSVSLFGHVTDLVSWGQLVFGVEVGVKLTLPSQLDVICFADHVHKQAVMYIKKQL